MSTKHSMFVSLSFWRVALSLIVGLAAATLTFAFARRTGLLHSNIEGSKLIALFAGFAAGQVTLSFAQERARKKSDRPIDPPVPKAETNANDHASGMP